MLGSKVEILDEVARYYSEKLTQHGETPQGVDWNGEASQILRFKQLIKIIADPKVFSIIDLGCGYGAFFDFLEASDREVRSYLGVDISADMIRAAQQRHRHHPQAQFVVSDDPNQIADYGVASGIFNVCMGRDDSEWFEYLQSTLDILNRTCKDGFAFNCLTSYSDADKKRENLYYADPCRVFDTCKRRYSKQVALLHDYGLYEFTILVRK